MEGPLAQVIRDREHVSCRFECGVVGLQRKDVKEHEQFHCEIRLKRQLIAVRNMLRTAFQKISASRKDMENAIEKVIALHESSILCCVRTRDVFLHSNWPRQDYAETPPELSAEAQEAKLLANVFQTYRSDSGVNLRGMKQFAVALARFDETKKVSDGEVRDCFLSRKSGSDSHLSVESFGRVCSDIARKTDSTVTEILSFFPRPLEESPSVIDDITEDLVVLFGGEVCVLSVKKVVDGEVVPATADSHRTSSDDHEHEILIALKSPKVAANKLHSLFCQQHKYCSLRLLYAPKTSSITETEKAIRHIATEKTMLMWMRDLYTVRSSISTDDNYDRMLALLAIIMNLCHHKLEETPTRTLHHPLLAKYSHLPGSEVSELLRSWTERYASEFFQCVYDSTIGRARPAEKEFQTVQSFTGVEFIDNKNCRTKTADGAHTLHFIEGQKCWAEWRRDNLEGWVLGRGSAAAVLKEAEKYRGDCSRAITLHATIRRSKLSNLIDDLAHISNLTGPLSSQSGMDVVRVRHTYYNKESTRRKSWCGTEMPQSWNCDEPGHICNFGQIYVLVSFKGIIACIQFQMQGIHQLHTVTPVRKMNATLQHLGWRLGAESETYIPELVLAPLVGLQIEKIDLERQLRKLKAQAHDHILSWSDPTFANKMWHSVSDKSNHSVESFIAPHPTSPAHKKQNPMQVASSSVSTVSLPAVSGRSALEQPDHLFTKLTVPKLPSRKAYHVFVCPRSSLASEQSAVQLHCLLQRLAPAICSGFDVGNHDKRRHSALAAVSMKRLASAVESSCLLIIHLNTGDGFSESTVLNRRQKVAIEQARACCIPIVGLVHISAVPRHAADKQQYLDTLKTKFCRDGCPFLFEQPCILCSQQHMLSSCEAVIQAIEPAVAHVRLVRKHHQQPLQMNLNQEFLTSIGGRQSGAASRSGRLSSRYKRSNARTKKYRRNKVSVAKTVQANLVPIAHPCVS